MSGVTGGTQRHSAAPLGPGRGPGGEGHPGPKVWRAKFASSRRGCGSPSRQRRAGERCPGHPPGTGGISSAPAGSPRPRHRPAPPGTTGTAGPVRDEAPGVSVARAPAPGVAPELRSPRCGTALRTPSNFLLPHTPLCLRHTAGIGNSWHVSKIKKNGLVFCLCVL